MKLAYYSISDFLISPDTTHTQILIFLKPFQPGPVFASKVRAYLSVTLKGERLTLP